MTDISKVYRDLHKAMESYRLFAEPPTVRLAREIHNAFKLEQTRLSQMTSAANDLQKSLALHPRVLAEIKAMQQAMTANRAAIDHFVKLPALHDFRGVFGHLDALQQMRSQIRSISETYSSFGLQIQRFALRPTTFGVAHISGTTELLSVWEARQRPVDPLMASISCTEAQVVSQDEDILEYPEVFDFTEIEEADEDDTATVPTHNLYFVQRSELIVLARKMPHFLDDERSLNSLPTFRYFNLAQSVCRLVTIINRQCAVSGIDAVFRLTDRLAESLVALPNLIAVDGKNFAEFVDYLYFIIYEGAGKDNLRFLGLIGPDDAEPVWVLKHIRNYLTRHDVEHGKEKDIKKKQERLGAIFSSLIEKPLPRTRRDFGDAQIAFLMQIEAMLKKVSDELERRATENDQSEAGV